MRINEQAKQQTRQRILATAAELFADKGFEESTTREIAQAAGLATGTMFNYFPSKETMAMTMVTEALRQGGKTSVAAAPAVRGWPKSCSSS